MAVDLLYSVKRGMLPEATASIISLIERIGFVVCTPVAGKERRRGADHPRGSGRVREHLGGELTITLVPEIGRKIEVHRNGPGTDRGSRAGPA